MGRGSDGENSSIRGCAALELALMVDCADGIEDGYISEKHWKVELAGMVYLMLIRCPFRNWLMRRISD